MLKRQRPSSPMPMAAEAPLAAEASIGIDMSERVAKRARYFAPLRRSFLQKKDIDVGSDTDGEENQGDEGRSEYARGQSQWQEAAGLYKNANTLLHDLHAEQRHRQLFAADMSPSVREEHVSQRTTRSQPSSMMGLRHSPQGIPMPRSEQNTLPCDPSYHPSIRTGVYTEHVEARIVSSQYQDTNRFLRDLFLSRRRRLDTDRK